MSTKAKDERYGRIDFYDDKDQFGHPRIPFRGHYDREHCDKRRAWAEKFANCSLEQCGQWWLDEGSNESCSCLRLKGNVENPIGLAKIPLAICGPLLIKGKHLQGFCLCPFATTEGALVASITRGATALSRAGGVYTRVIDHAQIRSPSFIFRNMDEVETFMKWLASKFNILQQRVSAISQHAQLTKMDNRRFGCAVIVNFHYSTGDACGQNMVTSCSHDLCRWILTVLEEELPEVKLSQYFLETGMSGDKKIGFINHWRTRGHNVQAEAWIPSHVLKSVLKVDISTFLQYYNIMQTTFLYSGIIGLNLNISNLIAGVFIATGQDVAAVESCHAQLFITPLTKEEWISHGLELAKEVNSKEIYAGLYASIVIPSLNVGTVGGGVGLATQRECLKLIGCNEENDVGKLCEVIAAFALSLELSTMSAIASNQFAKAHEKLGRNHPDFGLKQEDLNKDFFSEILGEGKTLVDFTPYQVDAGSSILSDITKKEVHKMVGHFGYILKYSTQDGKLRTLKIVLKSKTTALETCNMLSKIAHVCGLNLATEYEKWKLKTGFNDCDVREVLLYRMKELLPFCPEIYYTRLQPTKEVFLIAMEFLSNSNYSHLDTVDNISVWSKEDIQTVLRDLASLHSLYLKKTSTLDQIPWLKNNSREKKLFPLWKEILNHAKFEFPRVWMEKRAADTLQAIHCLDKIDTVLSEAPQTLVHNDCNPRNMCLHKHVDNSSSETHRLCLYDWELATIDTPQRDLVEFLSFIFEPSTSIESWLEAINFYRNCLEECSGYVYSTKRFIEVFNCAAWDYTIRRLLMYTMAHTLKDYTYLPRVVNSMFTYLDYISKKNMLSFIQNSKL